MKSEGGDNQVPKPLDEDEKDELAKEYGNIVYFIANKYRFFDEKEEVVGWGNIGLAKAINKYEKRPKYNFASYAFPAVKQAIFDQYRRGKGLKSQDAVLSLHKEFNSSEGSSFPLIDKVSSNDNLDYSYEEIRKMVDEALFEEPELNKKIVIDLLFTDTTPEALGETYCVSKEFVRKALRKCKTLIKNYLVSNAYISDYLMEPGNERKSKENIINHRELLPDDYGKIKYIYKFYSFLRITDIAIILNTSSHAIRTMFDFPTTAYLSAKLDHSIDQKALKYIRKKYPERMAGEVKVYKMNAKELS